MNKLRVFSTWMLYALVVAVGVYINILFKRTRYGNYGTHLGCDTVIVTYALCLFTLFIAMMLFIRTKPISKTYLFCLILSFALVVSFFIMNSTGMVIGIGDGIEGSWQNFICPAT